MWVYQSIEVCLFMYTNLCVPMLLSLFRYAYLCMPTLIRRSRCAKLGIPVLVFQSRNACQDISFADKPTWVCQSRHAGPHMPAMSYESWCVRLDVSPTACESLDAHAIAIIISSCRQYGHFDLIVSIIFCRHHSSNRSLQPHDSNLMC